MLYLTWYTQVPALLCKLAPPPALLIIFSTQTLWFLCPTAQGGDGHGWDGARKAAGEVRARKCWSGWRRRRRGDGGQNRGLAGPLRKAGRGIKDEMWTDLTTHFHIANINWRFTSWLANVPVCSLASFVPEEGSTGCLLNQTWTQVWLNHKSNNSIVSIFKYTGLNKQLKQEKLL